ncbi:MAG: hypothetical protein ACRED5_21160, partial [Propylenella sp.]
MSERQRTTRRAGLLFAVFLATSTFPAQSYSQGGETFVPTGATQALQARTSRPIAAVPHGPMPLGAPALTAAERARVEYWSNRLPLRGPDPRPAAAPLAAPAPSTATIVDGPKPMALGTLQLRQNFNLLPIIPTDFSSSTNEPSTAMAGRNRFQTGNWYAAYSSNAGTTWTHLSPFTAFPAIDGGFCCDQETIFVPSRNMFIWFLQYIKSGSTAGSTGGIRIAVFNSHTANISNA